MGGPGFIRAMLKDAIGLAVMAALALSPLWFPSEAFPSETAPAHDVKPESAQ